MSFCFGRCLLVVVCWSLLVGRCARRPTAPYSPLPEALLNHVPEMPLSLVMKNLKCARRGAAAGPSGMTSEHLRSVLENPRDAGLLFQVAQLFATACIPQEVLAALRVGRLTALQKPNGSVRAIERATSPFQYALSTRAGTECIAHVIQALTDLDSTATVLSTDGISAFDVVSRQAMLQGFSQWLEGMQQCHLCGSSTGQLRVICGKTTTASSTQSYKQKVVNRVTH